jgi:hypothetical protein
MFPKIAVLNSPQTLNTLNDVYAKLFICLGCRCLEKCIYFDIINDAKKRVLTSNYTEVTFILSRFKDLNLWQTKNVVCRKLEKYVHL